MIRLCSTPRCRDGRSSHHRRRPSEPSPDGRARQRSPPWHRPRWQSLPLDRPSLPSRGPPAVASEPGQLRGRRAARLLPVPSEQSDSAEGGFPLEDPRRPQRRLLHVFLPVAASASSPTPPHGSVAPRVALAPHRATRYETIVREGRSDALVGLRQRLGQSGAHHIGRATTNRDEPRPTDGNRVGVDTVGVAANPRSGHEPLCPGQQGRRLGRQAAPQDGFDLLVRPTCVRTLTGANADSRRR